MKWFKHDSDAFMDAKLKKLKIRYGMEGYGLYWYCLEIITAGVDQYSLTFELEHDAEIIAHDTGLHFEQVQEIMEYMVKLKLFENVDGHITCLKLAKRLDQSMTSNTGLRNLIKNINNHDSIMMESSQNRIEQNRTEQNRETLGQNKNHFDRFYSEYPKKVKGKRAREIWKSKKLDSKADLIIADVKNRLAKDARWLGGYIPDPTTYLNGERWNDELEKSRPKEQARSIDWLRWGKENNMPAKVGESNEQYIRRLQTVRR